MDHWIRHVKAAYGDLFVSGKIVKPSSAWQGFDPRKLMLCRLALWQSVHWWHATHARQFRAKADVLKFLTVLLFLDDNCNWKIYGMWQTICHIYVLHYSYFRAVMKWYVTSYMTSWKECQNINPPHWANDWSRWGLVHLPLPHRQYLFSNRSLHSNIS